MFGKKKMGAITQAKQEGLVHHQEQLNHELDSLKERQQALEMIVQEILQLEDKQFKALIGKAIKQLRERAAQVRNDVIDCPSCGRVMARSLLTCQVCGAENPEFDQDVATGSAGSPT